MTRPAASIPVRDDARADGSYPGGKGLDGIYQWIISKFPTHARYCEPFAGKGAILRRKFPSLRTVVVDRNPEVIKWWMNFPEVQVIRGCGIEWMLEASTLLLSHRNLDRFTQGPSPGGRNLIGDLVFLASGSA